MKSIAKARDLLQEGETAVIIFTRGPEFIRHPDGTGLTGYWKLAPRIDVDWLIVYLRKVDGSNDVYRAKAVAVNRRPDDDRAGIELTSIERIGQTSATWYQFAETQANPVRYLQK